MKNNNSLLISIIKTREDESLTSAKDRPGELNMDLIRVGDDKRGCCEIAPEGIIILLLLLLLLLLRLVPLLKALISASTMNLALSPQPGLLSPKLIKLEIFYFLF